MIDFDELKAPENRGKLSLSLLRISMGILFIPPALGKVMREGGFNPTRFLTSRDQMPDWYRAIVDAVVVPNAEIFGFLVAYGELFMAIALILGAMVRPAMVLGVFMIVNFMLAKGAPFWSASNHDSLYVLIFLVLYFNDAGKFLGLENWVREKFPKLPT